MNVVLVDLAALVLLLFLLYYSFVYRQTCLITGSSLNPECCLTIPFSPTRFRVNYTAYPEYNSLLVLGIAIFDSIHSVSLLLGLSLPAVVCLSPSRK